MSYINQIIKIEIRAKENTILNNIDADYIAAKLEAIKYELQNIIGDKVDIEITYE